MIRECITAVVDERKDKLNGHAIETMDTTH